MNEAYLKELQQPCPCGREHVIPVREVIIESGALCHLQEMLDKHGFTGTGYIICDENTYKKAGERVCSLLHNDHCIILNPENLHANEAAVAEVLEKTPDADYYIAVGSGTIHDITRYVTYEKGLQFLSVPTAASVDGYVSNMAAMTLNGLKITVPSRMPLVMVADLDIIADAPYRLTCSGVGDILGKYIALADWKIAHIVTGEYFCQKVYDLESQVVADVVSLLDGLKTGDKKAFGKLMEALVLSGIAMQMVRISRPASGVEHHISHFWEMHVLENDYEVLHGEKVGVATGMALNIYKKFLQIPDIAPYMKPYAPIDPEDLRTMFGHLTEYVMKENTPDSLLAADPTSIAAHFAEIQEVIRALPEPEEIIGKLQDLGGSALPADVGVTPEMLKKTLRYCMYARNRLSFYRMTRLMDTEKLCLY